MRLSDKRIVLQPQGNGERSCRFAPDYWCAARFLAEAILYTDSSLRRSDAIPVPTEACSLPSFSGIRMLGRGTLPLIHATRTRPIPTLRSQTETKIVSDLFDCRNATTKSFFDYW